MDGQLLGRQSDKRDPRPAHISCAATQILYTNIHPDLPSCAQNILDSLSSDDATSDEEHFRLGLVQLDLERAKWLLKGYLRVRLHKVRTRLSLLLAARVRSRPVCFCLGCQTLLMCAIRHDLHPIPDRAIRNLHRLNALRARKALRSRARLFASVSGRGRPLAAVQRTHLESSKRTQLTMYPPFTRHSTRPAITK